MRSHSKILILSGAFLFTLFINLNFSVKDLSVENSAEHVKYYSRISWNNQQGIFAADLIHPSTSLIGQQIIMFPRNYLDLNISGVDFDLTPTSTKTIYDDTLLLDKKLSLFNPTQITDSVEINADTSGVLTITIHTAHVTNGPFTVFPDGNKLIVRSHYNGMDIVPLKVIYKNEKDVTVDVVEFIWEEYYPPYYVSRYYSNKNVITNEDIVDILESYSNLSGDYFDVNPKRLVCTDAVTLPIKTVGINYLALLNRYNIKGNNYLQRNSSILLNLLEKLNLKNEYVHYFMDGKRSTLYKYPEYENLTAENFGIRKFKPGQVMFWDRYYNTGPRTGEIQSMDIHTALISGISDGRITRAAMVTSRSRKPPYDTLIMLNSRVNFPAWFGARQHYTGSDETDEELRYVVYAIMDLQHIIQKLRSIHLPSLLAIK